MRDSNKLNEFLTRHLKIKHAILWIYRMLRPLALIYKPKTIISYFQFFRDLSNFKFQGGQVNWLNLFPILFEKTSTTGIDPHYFYQGIWAFKKINQQKPQLHIDVGSQTLFVGMLTTVTKVEFVDIRPLEIILPNYKSLDASIMHMPYNDESVESISCLHVLEHIGLGRYGDPIDPNGTYKACIELERILKVGGNLFISLPIGKPRIEFNAHKIHTVDQVTAYFKKLLIKEFSAVFDDGSFHENIDPKSIPPMNYGLGLFWLTKTTRNP